MLETLRARAQRGILRRRARSASDAVLAATPCSLTRGRELQMVIKIGISMGVTMYLTKWIVKLMEPMIDPNYKQKQDAARSRRRLMQRLGAGAALGARLRVQPGVPGVRGLTCAPRLCRP